MPQWFASILERIMDFSNILNASIAASWMVLTVIILRFLLKNAPKWSHVALWGLVALRLLLPFSIESNLSLIPSTETVPQEILRYQGTQLQTPAYLDVVSNPNFPGSVSIPAGHSVDYVQWQMVDMTFIWLAGIAALLLYTAVSYRLLRRKVDTAVRYRDNIFQSEHVGSPFVLGIIKPRIYLPYHMDQETLHHVIAHEQAHIRRRDHWWKPLGFLLLTIHWFNPIMWLAYVLLCRDIELACDESVIRELGHEQRADYTQALVSCSVNRRRIAACPLAFGEVGVKERVKSVMNYRKPAFWVIVLSIVACTVVAVCFLTDPQKLTIYDIFDQNGYSVINQEEVDITLYVEKSKLPDSIYTAEGHEFKPNEVLAYSTETSRIYLHKAMVSNESDDLLYLIFDCSYDLPEFGSFVSPYQYTEESDSTLSTLHLRSNDLRDSNNTTYQDALNMRGHGPGSQFAFYVSKEACMAAEGTLMIDVTCNQIEYARVGHGYDSQQSSSSANSSVVKWFDYLDNPSAMSAELTAELQEFPEVVFEFTRNQIIASKPFSAYDSADPKAVTLMTGMPIWNAYFTDLTGDSFPELCSTVSLGSGDIHNIIIVYDYANGKVYDMAERGKYDFTLRLNEEDGYLYVDKQVHPWGELVTSGRLAFKDNCIQILEETTSSSVVIDIVDPTEDKNFSYDTATEKFFEDEVYDYFFGGIYSQHVIVHYADGTTEDIVTALNSGKASIADLDRFGIPYWAEPKVDPLDAAIRSAIIEVNTRPDSPYDLCRCASFVLLDKEEFSITPVVGSTDHIGGITVYGLALYQGYDFGDNKLHVVEDSHTPVAITFHVKNGKYSLKEYWRPGDGSYYVPDIRDKFPDEIEEEVLDTKKYIDVQLQECYAQAEEWRNSL